MPVDKGMSAVVAIKKWLEAGPNGTKTPVPEIKALKSSSTREEFEKMGVHACEGLGVPFKPAK